MIDKATLREKANARSRIYHAAHREKANARRRAHYVAHLEKASANARIYHAAHREEDNIRSKVYHVTHREGWRAAEMKRKYGLIPEAFQALLASQGGVCAACGTSDWSRRYGTPAIDHDHKSGRVRGLLCSKCNTAAGMLDDSADKADKLAAYLRSRAVWESNVEAFREA